MIRINIDPPICKGCHMSTNVIFIYFPETNHMIWYCELCNKELITTISLQDDPKQHSEVLQMQEQQVCKTEEKI